MATKKNKIWIALLGCIGLLFFTACNKQGTNVTLPANSGTAPILSASLADSIPLDTSKRNNPVITFNWTNPNYLFSNGVSSLNVTYNIDVDTLGANFTSPKKQTLQVVSALDTTLTTDQVNSIAANGLGLNVGQTHTLQVRVTSFLAPYTSGSANIAPLASNVLVYKVVPYSPPPAVTPPSSGQLFMVGGDPLLGAWANPVPATQQFAKLSDTHYQLTIKLSGGSSGNSNDQYLLIPVNGSWSSKYACVKTSSQPVSGGTFGFNSPSGGSQYSQNFPGPSSAGTYLFDVDFQKGIITVTQQ